MPKQFVQFLPILIVVLIALRRSGRTQRVRTTRAWTIPLLSVAAVASTLSQEQAPGPYALALFALALLLGAAAGYLGATHIELTTDPESGQVMSKATPIGTVLIVVFILIRFGLDYLIGGKPSFGPSIPHGPSVHGVDLFRLADAALIFSTTMSIAQRLELLRRAQPLLAAIRSGNPGG